MTSQQLFYLNVFIGTAFVVYFLLGRKKPPAPTRLNLKRNVTNSDENLKLTSQMPKTESLKLNSNQKMTVLEPENDVNTVGLPTAKALGAFFIYNGHDWEAHAVLGVPQGASMAQVTTAYQQLILKSDPEQFLFLESAYKTLLNKSNKNKL